MQQRLGPLVRLLVAAVTALWAGVALPAAAQVCGNGILELPERCDDGNTVDGDCCASDCTFEPAAQSCDADADLCTIDECDGAGACLPVGNVSCPGPTGACDGGEACDPGTGSCFNLPHPAAGTSCDLDVDLCTIDECDGVGACVFVGDVICPGPTGTCDAGYVPGSCDPATGCDELPDPDAGTACEADGDLCTTDQCDGAGACVFVGGCTGPTGACDGGQACDPGTGCVDLPHPAAGTSCDLDGDLCTIDECDGVGACVPSGGNVSCPGPSGTCDGGQECDPSTGSCADLADPGVGTSCDLDADMCTIDECDGAGACVFADTLICDDGLFCNGAETCDPGLGCQRGADPCLGQECDEGGGVCFVPEVPAAGGAARVGLALALLVAAAALTWRIRRR